MLDHLVVRKGKCVAVGACVNFELDLLVFHFASYGPLVIWHAESYGYVTPVSELSSELVSTLCTGMWRLHTANQWLGFLQ